MRIIDSNTVELTTVERRAYEVFDVMLDDGHSIIVAALRVEELYPGLDPAFYRWLKDEPLLRDSR